MRAAENLGRFIWQGCCVSPRESYDQHVSNERRVREFWQRVWSVGQVQYAHEFFSDPYVENDRERTPEGHAKGAVAFREFFPDFTAEVVRLISTDNVVVSRVIYRGTYAGGWAGVSRVGTQVEVSGLDVFFFEAGVVVEHLHEADHEGLWEQLGVAFPSG